MGRQKDKQYGTLEGQPPLGPRQHLLEREQVEKKKTPQEKLAPGELEHSERPAYGHGQKH
jgi:hypothetical protein